MIRKEQKLVITFYTTTDAMAMEQVCKVNGAEGRIIPVPPSILAGCGLAWCAKLESEWKLRSLMEKENISFQEIRECLI